MPAELPRVNDWPTKHEIKPNDPKPEHVRVLETLKAQPPNEIYVVAAGLTRPQASNLRAWLSTRPGVTARTTGRAEELQRYSEQLAAQGIDFTQLHKPNNHIVLAQHTTTE